MHTHLLSTGAFLDPYEGARSMPGSMLLLGFSLGLFKGLVGLMARPSAGVIEGSSKLLQGLGLLCLGKRGIQVGSACDLCYVWASRAF